MLITLVIGQLFSGDGATWAVTENSVLAALTENDAHRARSIADEAHGKYDSIFSIITISGEAIDIDNQQAFPRTYLKVHSIDD